MRTIDPADYPTLTRIPMVWGASRGVFRISTDLPPAEQIGNVLMVPYTTEGWAAVALANGEYYPPGGALEPGETIDDAIRRELMEEAGAVVGSFTVFGSWEMLSSADKPYRPHSPHPVYAIVAGYGEITITGQSREGEPFAGVVTGGLDMLCAQFDRQNRRDISELYRLAARLRETA